MKVVCVLISAALLMLPFCTADCLKKLLFCPGEELAQMLVRPLRMREVPGSTLISHGNSHNIRKQLSNTTAA